jgi:hypothetical protein
MAWIDDWLPHWQFEEVHHIRSSAAPAALLDAAAAYDPAHDAWISAALALREAPARLGARLGGGTDSLAQRRRFGLSDFVRLGRDGDAALAYGLAGRFWEPGYGLQPLADATAWHAHAPTDAAKLVLGFETQRSAGCTTLTTRTRVFCSSEAARRRLAGYWLLIRPVSGLIRRRILADIRRAAER